MCTTIQYIEGQAVPCRNCWQCRSTRVNDLVGRSIAEYQTCKKAVALTLTYKGDTVNSSVLTYADVQNFVKRLRSAGFPCRYIVAGEFGTLKGRAHWHMVLFFTQKVPDLPVERKRQDWKYWTNHQEGRGFVFTQPVNYAGIRYLLKYALKDQTGTGYQSLLSMSKKPPLGHKYFLTLADRLIEARIAPQDASYQFSSVRDFQGNIITFYLRGRMLEMFIQYYVQQYKQRWGDYPASPFVDEVIDKTIDLEVEWTDARWMDYLASKKISPPNEETTSVHVVANSYLSEQVTVEHNSDGTFTVIFPQEDKQWHVKTKEQLIMEVTALGLTIPERTDFLN